MGNGRQQQMLRLVVLIFIDILCGLANLNMPPTTQLTLLIRTIKIFLHTPDTNLLTATTIVLPNLIVPPTSLRGGGGHFHTSEYWGCAALAQVTRLYSVGSIVRRFTSPKVR